MKIIKKQPYITQEEDSAFITVTDFTAESARDFMERMFQLESDSTLTDVFIYVTTYGGEVLALLSMIEVIRASEKNVHIVTVGEADSCGAMLVTTGPVGRRWMAPNSYMLIHEIRDGMYGAASSIQQLSEHIQIVQNKIFGMIVQNSVLTMDGLKRRIKDNHGEWLISANEALTLKLIDKIGIPKIKANIIWELED